MKMNSELVFIPSPGVGHVVSAVETAKLLIDRDERLSITVLIMKLPSEIKLNGFVSSDSWSSRLRFVDLPYDESKPNLISPHTFLSSLVDSHKPKVKSIAAEIIESDSTTRLAGFVVDMFCASMIDVANELGVPSYVYFTCGAAMLGLMFHLQSLRDDHGRDIIEFKGSDAELAVPSFINPVPAKVLPSVVLDKEGGSTMFLNLARRFRETKGIIINTFLELEPYAIESLTNDGEIPPIYPVGPILHLKKDNSSKNDEAKVILEWLDDQPLSSVVFLCFGSMGSFGEEQIKEIAAALERSGHRFLWSLRRPPSKEKLEFPSDYSNPEEVLPDGFLERTAGIGKVIGWSPQVEVMSHSSVGGFVSHCGWNSTLESVWCGVPIATWPMYAEQQMNAFELVKELGIAVEMKMDYRKDFRTESSVIVTADVIENVLRQLMMGGELIGKKVKEASEKSRMALNKGGSSYTSLGHLIDDIFNNIA